MYVYADWLHMLLNISGGNEGGSGLADVLLGKYSPSGRLPITFYRDSDLPPGDRSVSYGTYDMSQSQRTYRYSHSRPPLFYFGFGLSYTTFEYTSLKVVATAAVCSSVEVSFAVSNTGFVVSDEVPQLYITVTPPQNFTAQSRPLIQLAGFTRESKLPPNREPRSISFTVAAQQLALFSADGQEMFVGPFTVDVWIGGRQPTFSERGLVGRPTGSQHAASVITSTLLRGSFILQGVAKPLRQC